MDSSIERLQELKNFVKKHYANNIEVLKKFNALAKKHNLNGYAILSKTDKSHVAIALMTGGIWCRPKH